ncbi:MAG: pyridoxal-phosphate dependent enzyme, partial [Candidatus Thermoplasmatota archaeon]|nr:pyridoxal-phosphate dependent enzyme [Candidatus Thermoplasmatota archaeon]
MICNDLRLEYGENILSRIGNTPLIKLERMFSGSSATSVFAKAEWFNPGGSVKDRAACAIIDDAVKSGSLTEEKILLDASSGNTGIAYSMICAVRGFRSAIVVPGNVGKEKLEMLRAY